MAAEDEFPRLISAMKHAVGALRDAGVPFALAGGLAVFARGGPASDHDVDFLVKPGDAERALAALEEAGMRTERPPEGWLYKAFDGETLIDLIFEPMTGPVTDEVLGRAEQLEVMALRLPVVPLEDVIVTKLLAVTEQEPDYSGVLEIARAVREQVDWDEVRSGTADSPFAHAFFVLVEELGIIPRPRAK